MYYSKFNFPYFPYFIDNKTFKKIIFVNNNINIKQKKFQNLLLKELVIDSVLNVII